MHGRNLEVSCVRSRQEKSREVPGSYSTYMIPKLHISGPNPHIPMQIWSKRETNYARSLTNGTLDIGTRPGSFFMNLPTNVVDLKLVRYIPGLLICTFRNLYHPMSLTSMTPGTSLNASNSTIPIYIILKAISKTCQPTPYLPKLITL